MKKEFELGEDRKVSKIERLTQTEYTQPRSQQGHIQGGNLKRISIYTLVGTCLFLGSKNSCDLCFLVFGHILVDREVEIRDNL